MNATADSQERWHRFYEAVSKDGSGAKSFKVLQKKAATRLLWERAFMIGSTAALVGLTSVFYSVLTRSP